MLRRMKKYSHIIPAVIRTSDRPAHRLVPILSVTHNLMISFGNFACMPSFPHMCYTFRLSHLQWFDTPGGMWLQVHKMNNQIITIHNLLMGHGSSVGIVTAYGLDGPEIESRWEARFSAPVQTGPEAHPASCTMGTGSFLGVRCGRGVTLTPHPLLVPRSKIQ